MAGTAGRQESGVRIQESGVTGSEAGIQEAEFRKARKAGPKDGANDALEVGRFDETPICDSSLFSEGNPPSC